MRLMITKDHRHFFEQYGWVEFSNFIKPQTLLELRRETDSTITQRLKIAPNKLQSLSSLRTLVASRDLWRSNPAIKQIILQQGWAQIASELTGQKTLRVGFDQYLPKLNQAGEQDPSAHELHSFLTIPHSLQEIASIQGIICGLMLCLDSNETTEHAPLEGQTTDKPHTAPFSLVPGNAIFFSPNLPFSLQDPIAIQGDYLLILYADHRAVYVHQPEDPFTHVLKNFGYVFGDRLNDVLHPILLR